MKSIIDKVSKKAKHGLAVSELVKNHTFKWKAYFKVDPDFDDKRNQRKAKEKDEVLFLIKFSISLFFATIIFLILSLLLLLLLYIVFLIGK